MRRAPTPTSGAAPANPPCTLDAHTTRRDEHIVMTPDSAWRQWKGAVRGLAAAEELHQQTRAIWLQVLLEGFEQRRLDADGDGRDVTTKEALAMLGLPCKDCLAPVPPNCGGHTVVNGREGDTYQLYAICGKAAIDPTAGDMPQLFALPEAVKR